MLWLYVAAAAAGALLGLSSLRAPAVLAGSVVFVAIAVVLMAFRRWPLLEAVINVFMLLATLQFSYLVGLSGIRRSVGGRLKSACADEVVLHASEKTQQSLP